ncbi:MAG: glycosyltransferase family 2 protein [Candidatus Methanomethyliaceae archaeon]
MRSEGIKKPKVSVIMPVYNSERYLRQAIESVLSQTYQDFELIIVDDGSTDNSQAIIKEYAGKDKRIYYAFHEENRGVSAARNTALSLAQGEWVAVIDSDDAWHPERLEKLLEIVGNGVFVADDLLFCFDRNGELIPWKRQLSSIWYSIFRKRVLEMHLVDYLQKGPSCLKPVFPRSAVFTHELRFTEGCQFAEDFEFWCHLFLVGLKLRILLEPLYFYRLTPHSLTAKANTLKNFDHYLGVLDRLLANPGFSKEERRLLEYYRRKAEKERDYSLFTYSLEKRHYREAFHWMKANPSVLFRLLARFPHSLAYRVSAKIKGGIIKV